MYKLLFKVINRKNKKKEFKEFILGKMDTPEYDAMMEDISETLYNMDLEYNDIDGDGDMVVDDMLIYVSDEEDFEKKMQGTSCDYYIKGSNM